MRKFVAASVVVLVAFAVATAEEIMGVVTKFEGGKITVQVRKGKDTPPTDRTLSVADNVKIKNASFSFQDRKWEVQGDFEGGKDALAKRVKESAAKAKENKDETKKFRGFGGVFAQVITEGEGDAAKVVEIRVSKGFGGKKKNN